ncbi:ubiquitin carboxyl-terminal hydrolase 20-like [Rhododendron vialii]|uniref:ubiquitin carboxyl-terminal hydrolase 20-like n=1 Tax=Rhododendron vialii TaxID=182163 RepID=UPI00265FA61A|nr:ubiquitin carboxyl-terminal hydrolase 20-like [Rhododendron vialii]
MDAHHLESPPPDSDQTLNTSPHDSPPQTLDDLPISTSLSPTRDETLHDQPNPVSLVDYDAPEGDDEEEKEDALRSPSPPSYYVSAFSSSSHWSSAPWSSAKGTRDSGWPSWVSKADAKPSKYDWPETWLSAGAGDAKAFESDWSDPFAFEEETEPEPLAACDDTKPAMVGAGLANLGNTCFLNAILQCFTHTVPLVQGLKSSDHPSPCDRETEGFCVLCALRSLIELSLTSKGSIVSPWRLFDNLNYISSDFRRFQQEDAHEFLQCLLDRLESCCTYSKTRDTCSSEDENLVKRVFGGRLISKLQCCNCGHCSDTYEPLIDLSLEIENVSDLPSALESFTKVEKIEDSETKFTCENCKEEVSLEKQLMLDRAPSVAAFHLKRFKNYGSYVEKIDKHVEFPLELDLLPYIDDSQNNDVELKYDLYAIVVHSGFSSTSGHYYCFIRSGPDSWYRLDDSKVTRVREEYVLSQEAYILFYAKQGTLWFSSLMETVKASLDPYIPNNSPNSVLDDMDHISISSPNLSNNPSCEENEAREDVFGIDLDVINGGMPSDIQVNEATTIKPNLGSYAKNYGRAVDVSHKFLTPVPQGTDNSYSSSRMPCNTEKKISPSALRDSACNQNFNEVEKSASVTRLTPPTSALRGYTRKKNFNEVEKSVNISLLTPPRSCNGSPDKYAELPVVSCSIRRGHLMSQKQVPCKRELVKDLDDSERKQACKLLKGMPNDRKAVLLAAMKGEVSPNSKRKRNDKPSTSRHKANVESYNKNAVAAGW